MDENEFRQPEETEESSQKLDSIEEIGIDFYNNMETIKKPDQPKKSGWLRMLLSVLLFVLLIVGGYYGWQELSDWRGKQSQVYAVKAAELVQEGNSQALWELEKAYWLGMDLVEYRQERAVYLATLGLPAAQDDLIDVIDKGWGNDLIYYWYGRILFDEGQLELATDYLTKVSPDVDYQLKKDIFSRLAVVAGNIGEWEAVQGYLDQAGKISGQNDWEIRAKFGLDLINDDLEAARLSRAMLDQAMLGQIEESRVDGLAMLRGDAYLLRVADLLIDVDLNGWADFLLRQASYETLDRLEVLLLQAKSALKGGDCQVAWNYLEQARELDGGNEKIHQLLVEVYKCLDYQDFVSYEESVLDTL